MCATVHSSRLLFPRPLPWGCYHWNRIRYLVGRKRIHGTPWNHRTPSNNPIFKARLLLLYCCCTLPTAAAKRQSTSPSHHQRRCTYVCPRFRGGSLLSRERRQHGPSADQSKIKSNMVGTDDKTIFKVITSAAGESSFEDSVQAAPWYILRNQSVSYMRYHEYDVY